MHMSFTGGMNSKTEFSWDAFKMQVLLGNQQGAIETMRKFKFSDVLFFRVVPDNSDLKYLEDTVRGQDLNLLQFAVAQGQEQLVKYILSEHKYISTATRQMKSLDPRILLANSQGDETLVLRLAVQHPSIFNYLWSTFGSAELFTFDQHLIPVL